MKPWVDYTNRDYESLSVAMKDLARERLPEWSDHSPNDLGILLIEMVAYMGDILSYYQDRIANESFLPTARERRSLLYLLRLIGYELRPAAAATTGLNLLFDAPDEGETPEVTIAPGAQFGTRKTATADAVIFEYTGPNSITINIAELPVVSSDDDRRLFSSLIVRHSQSIVDDPLGSSTGEPNQSFALSGKPAIIDSIEVFVDEVDEVRRWQRRDTLLYHITPDDQIVVSTVDDRHYYVQVDENDVASVVFGDGVFGRIPPPGDGNIRASYRIGGGAVGNVAARTITEIKTDIERLDEVFNPFPASGGQDQEDIEHARQYAPLAFRSRERAVTLNDFVALAQGYGGVAKAWAESFGWNTIYLYIAPASDPNQPAPLDLQPDDDLRQRLVEFFRDRKMVGTEVRVRPPVMVPIHLRLEVTANFNFFRSEVEQIVRNAVVALLSYGQVDFASNVYLSKVYEAVEAIPGVQFVNVSHFSRTAIQRRFRQIESDGRIEMDAAEIPTLGVLTLTVEGGIEAEGSLT